jgi:hypothetical protein
MKTSSLLLIAAAALTAAGIAAGAPAIAQNTPNGAVVDPEMGISFMPPRGWSAQKRPEGYVLSSGGQAGVVIIIPHEFGDLAEMTDEARYGLEDEENGIALALRSRVVPYGKNGIAGELEGTFQGQEARAYAIGIMSPRGGGVIVLAAVDPKSYSKLYHELVRTIVSSVAFLE